MKKITNPGFFLREALTGLWRHRVMTISSVFVLASCLLIMGVFYMLDKNLDVNLENLQLLNEMVVFTDADLTQDQVDSIGKDIEALDNVTEVTYTSKAEGLESMKATYSGYSELFDEIIANGDNPLSDSFTLKYKDNSKVYELEYALRSIPGVSKVNNRSDYAAKVESFKTGMSAVFMWLFILLLAVSFFVIFNTIKLAVHGRKAEIKVMRYIGATKGFVITPFVLEGAVIGIVSAAISFWGLYLLYTKFAEKLAAEVQVLTVLSISDSVPLLVISFLLVGIVCGIVPSLLSLSRSLSK